MKKIYQNLTYLVKDNLNLTETGEARKLMNQLGDVPLKGFFTKQQFYDVVMWKSPRPKKHYLSNSEDEIINISKLVLNSDSDDEKIGLLTSLKGVSIPVASSLLTIINPKEYGIIDIRVWQLLFLYNEVKTKPRGQGFNLEDYKNYLSILRKYSRIFDVGVRDIERTLFFYHKKIQEGKLYVK
jgi:thermostable 8-oxoguanine DNA glycosylase